MATTLKFGLLLPHFCEFASAIDCLDGARRAEAFGFDSVWVRDHLVFEPHGIEGERQHSYRGLINPVGDRRDDPHDLPRHVNDDLSSSSNSSRATFRRLEHHLGGPGHHGHRLRRIPS